MAAEGEWSAMTPRQIAATELFMQVSLCSSAGCAGLVADHAGFVWAAATLGGVNITMSPPGGTMGNGVTHAQRVARSIAVALMMTLAHGALAQQHVGQYEQPDIDYGARLYRS